MVNGEMMGWGGVIELRSGDNAVNGGACGGYFQVFYPLFALTIKGWR